MYVVLRLQMIFFINIGKHGDEYKTISGNEHHLMKRWH